MAEKADNMKLWNQVCETDPAITKKVDQRGGFTAICAQAQKKRATELWGPFGTVWGLRSLAYDYLIESGKVIEAWLCAEFFYPGGAFQISTDCAYRAGNDTRKKLRTDALTKALSDLGFNSDVFEGKFDDNKYVQGQNQKHGNNEPSPPTAGATDSGHLSPRTEEF